MRAGEFGPIVGLLQRVSHRVAGEVTGAERSADIIGSPETDRRTQEPEACTLAPGCGVWTALKARSG